MAVAVTNSEYSGVELREGVSGFLSARPALRAAMQDLIREARCYFPTEPLRLSVHQDPDHYAWQSLLLEVVCPGDIKGAITRMTAFENDYIDSALPDHGQDLVTLVVAA